VGAIREAIRRVRDMIFKKNIEQVINNSYTSPEMDRALTLWKEMEGAGGLIPPWVSDDVKTIRFSNTVARELASLITQNIDIQVESLHGDAQKADEMQEVLDKYFLRVASENIEKMIRLGGIMAKWNGEGIDYVEPDHFIVTDYDSNGVIRGCAFLTDYYDGNSYYTRIESHRYEGNSYIVENRAYKSSRKDDIGSEVSLKNTKWKDIAPITYFDGMNKPLFAYLKCPFSNTVDTSSPLGVSLFTDCIEELRLLDVAMSTLGTETETSAPIMFVDNQTIRFANSAGIELPKFVRSYDVGTAIESTVTQWQPNLQITDRKEGINFYLSIISYKCGFDPGYFVFNGQSISIATATQVEATERRTVNTVKMFRNILDRPNYNGKGRTGFVHDIAYILDTMYTINGEYSDSDYENYNLYCDFADLTANFEEDRERAYRLMIQGVFPKWYYLVQYEGFTEKEAKAIVEEAKRENETDEEGLFKNE
jgi:A118 family predicted phage portal protein